MLSMKEEVGLSILFFRGALFLLVIFFVHSIFIDFLPTFLSAYSDQRILMCTVLIIALAASLSLLASERILTRTWPVVPVVFFFLVGGFSGSTNSDYAFVEAIFFAVYFLALIVVGVLLNAFSLVAPVARFMLILVGLVVAVYSLLTLNVYLFAIFDGFSALDDVIPWGFSNIRYWSHAATWILPLLPAALHIRSMNRSSLWRWSIWIGASVWWWLIFLTVSRGTLISLFLATFFAFLIFRGALIPWIKTSLSMIICGLILWAVCSLLIPEIIFSDTSVRSLKGHDSGRFPMWEEAWVRMSESLVFGLGSQSWLTHEVVTSSYDQARKFAHPHNMFLMWALEYGWALIVALFCLVSVSIKRVWSGRKKQFLNLEVNCRAWPGLVVSAIAGFLHAGVSAVFLVPSSMMIGFCILTVFWAGVEQLKRGRSTDRESNKLICPKIPNSVLILTFISVSTLGVLWISKTLDYYRASESDWLYYSEKLGGGHLPRFWFHGNFPRPSSQMPSSNG